MARIVVTGGLGFIGSHLVRTLNKQKCIVYILDKNSKESTDLTSIVETREFFEEITDHKTKPIDTVFDLATLPLPLSLVEPYQVVYKIYCMGINLCELAREGYFKTLIHVSSSEVYDITTPYAAAKDAQDQLIKSYVNCFGIDARIVRPFNTYGEGQDLGAVIPNTIKRILKSKPPIIYGDGEHKRDLVYVKDTVKGIINIGQNGHQGISYDITSGDCYSVFQIVSNIINLMKYKGKITYLPSRRGDTNYIHSKTDISMEFTPLEEGLKRTIEWWKKQDFTL